MKSNHKITFKIMGTVACDVANKAFDRTTRMIMGGYCSITAANHGGTWLIKFGSKNYTHP